MGLKARDYMTTDVVVVGRAANVAEIAALLRGMADRIAAGELENTSH